MQFIWYLWNIWKCFDILTGRENCFCSFLFWGTSKSKDTKDLWFIWSKLLSCSWGDDQAETDFQWGILVPCLHPSSSIHLCNLKCNASFDFFYSPYYYIIGVFCGFYDSNLQFYDFCQVSARLSDLEVTLDAGIQHRNKALETVGSQLWRWTIMVIK